MNNSVKQKNFAMWIYNFFTSLIVAFLIIGNSWADDFIIKDLIYVSQSSQLENHAGNIYIPRKIYSDGEKINPQLEQAIPSAELKEMTVKKELFREDKTAKNRGKFDSKSNERTIDGTINNAIDNATGNNIQNSVKTKYKKPKKSNAIEKSAAACHLNPGCGKLLANTYQLPVTESHLKNLNPQLQVQKYKYEKEKFFKIQAVVGHTFVIDFLDSSEIKDIAGARDFGWDVIFKDNRVFLRPEKDAKRATMIVVTGDETYPFDLIPLQNTMKNINDRVMKLSVSSVALNIGKITDGEIKNLPLLSEQMKPRNYNYTMQIVNNSSTIHPSEVFDDGRFTYFKFDSNIEIPAIYIRSSLDTKEEWLTPSHRENSYVIMHSVSKFWTLRLGDAVVGIFNESFNSLGYIEQDLTTVNELQRVDVIKKIRNYDD